MNRIDTLQDELNLESPHLETNENYQLDDEQPVKNTLDEEFFNSNTLRTQERVETSEHGFYSSHASYSPEHMEPGEFLRG